MPSMDSSMEDIIAGKAGAASSSTDKPPESFSSSASFKSPAYLRGLHGVNVSGSLLIYRPNSTLAEDHVPLAAVQQQPLANSPGLYRCVGTESGQLYRCSGLISTNDILFSR